MKQSRRRFLQTSGAAAFAGVPIAVVNEARAQNAITEADAASLTWSKAPCRF